MKSIQNCGSDLSDNVLCNSNGTNETGNIFFTIRDGNLLVSSDTKEISKHTLTGFQSVSSESFNPKEEEGGEIYIEIICDNFEQSEESSINNISSSYRAFWKGDFESCIDRRTCIECGFILFTPQQLLHHLQNFHHIQNPDECFVCHKLFLNGSKKSDHLRQVHRVENPDVTCEVCLKVFGCESDKISHRMNHIERFKCKWCCEPFPCEYLLNCHLQNCSLCRNDLDCHICGCQFKSSHILQLHSLRHNHHSCKICDFSPFNANDSKVEDPAISLVKHFRTNHNPEEIESILQKLKIQDEEEETLDKLFMSQIEENLNKISETNPENCDSKCQKKLFLETVPNNHLEESSKTTETHLQCSECKKTFGSKEETLKHELVHQTPFSCVVCSLKFSHRRGYKKHMRLHGILVKPSSVRYTCRYCSVNCATLSALHAHLLIHTDQKPHLCDKCGLKFRRPNALKAHDLAVHNSRILNHCPQCDTASLSKSSLLRHIQCVHGGVRRFICGLCGNRSLQNQGLRRHLKSEHNLEFPPMQSLCKKSSMEIHVIPSAENLSPDDPIADILKLAVREEKLKLEALRKLKTSEELANNDNHKSSFCSESVTEGQSLNILGDVASKALPLEPANILPGFFQTKSQDGAKFTCAGCQHCSYSVNDHSLHLKQCQQERTISLVEQANNEVSADKPQVLYALSSTFTRTKNEISNGMPYQLCFVPPLHMGTFSQGIPVCNNNTMETAVLSSINAEESEQLPQTSGNFVTATISSRSLEFSRKVKVDNPAEFAVPETELNRGSKLPVDILPANGIASSQMEFLQPSSFIFQEEREDTCKIYDLNESFSSNPVSSNGGNLESLKHVNFYSLKHVSSGAIGPKVAQASSERNIVSATVFDQPKRTNSSNSCIPLSEASVPLSSFPGENSFTANCDIVVQAEQDSGHIRSNSKGSKSMKSLAKPMTDATNHIYRDSSLLDTEMIDHSTSALAKGVQVCPECGKQLSSASSFKRHLEVHFGGKAHQCPHCDKCFRYKHNVTVHLRSHTGARPFNCSACDRKFRYLSELNEHKLSHNGAKMFSCSECGQLFARLRDLRRHSLCHGKSEKPRCCICQKTFSRADYLKRHMKSHKSSSVIDCEESISYEIENTKSEVMEKSRKKARNQMEILLGVESTSHRLRKSDCSSLKSQSTHSSSTGNDCSSDDLISLAYQAAEDGVEFMFVEEVATCYEKDVEVSSSEEANVIFIQT